MTKSKIVTIHVVPFLRGLQWHIKVNGRRVSRFADQNHAERCAVFLAKLMPAATVRFHKRNGRMRNEQTYPRSADPSKSPG